MSNRSKSSEHERNPCNIGFVRRGEARTHDAIGERRPLSYYRLDSFVRYQYTIGLSETSKKNGTTDGGENYDDPSNSSRL